MGYFPLISGCLFLPALFNIILDIIDTKHSVRKQTIKTGKYNPK